MTRRRHPAQASRILTAGLSTATMLGIVAVLGARTPPTTPPQVPRPEKVAVALREPGTRPPDTAARRTPPTTRRAAPSTRGARHGASPSPRRAPHTTTNPS